MQLIMTSSLTLHIAEPKTDKRERSSSIYNTGISEKCVSMLISRKPEVSLGVLRHADKKPHRTCTTQLASSIIFICLFWNCCVFM